MPKLLAPPACLVIGQDHDFLQTLDRRFGTRISILRASADESLKLLYSADFRIVVILWHHQAMELAHRISKINPHIDVIVEQSRGSLTPSTGQNGFIALLEKNQDRQELLDQIEHTLLNVQPSDEAVSRQTVSPHLNLASLVNRLPQIPLVLDHRERLAHHLLDSVCAALRTHSGGLFLHDKATASYALVSRRNLGGFLNSMRIEDASPLVKRISSQEFIIAGGADNVDPLVGSFLCQAHCNFILPLILGEDLLGWFLLKVPEKLARENSDLILSMAFFSSECLRSESERSRTTEETAVLRQILSSLAEAVLWIREDRSMVPISDGASLFDARGEIQDAPYGRLASSKFKMAIQKAFDGDPHSFSWTHKKGGGRAYQGHAEHIPGFGVLLSLRKEVSPEGNIIPDNPGFPAAKVLLSNEISLQMSRLKSNDPGPYDLSMDTVFYLLEAQSLLESPESAVSLDWLAQNLKNLPGLSLKFNDGAKEQAASIGLSAPVAAGFLVFFSHLSRHQKDLDLRVSLGRDSSSLAIDVHADKLDYPRTFTQSGLQKEVFLSTLAGLGLQLEAAAFGIRLGAACLQLANSHEKVDQVAHRANGAASKPALAVDSSVLSIKPMPVANLA